MAAAKGMLTQLGIGSSAPVTVRLDYQSENLAMNEEIVDGNGLRGTMSSNVDRTRPSLQRVGGPISFMPNAFELGSILQWILGGTPTGTGTVTYPLADALISKTVSIDRISKVFTYDTCAVNKATFRGEQGQCLTVDLDLVGLSESEGASGSFPSLSINTATGPWIYSDCVITIGGTTVTPKQIEITIDHFIDRERFFNSLTLAGIANHDRAINFSCSIPYGDQSAIYASGETGAAVVVTFTNGANILTMTMAAVVFGRQSPSVPGRSEIMLPINGRAYKTGSTLELVTTLAS